MISICKLLDFSNNSIINFSSIQSKGKICFLFLCTIKKNKFLLFCYKILFIKFMKSIAIAGLLATLGATQVAPPVWPEVFSQSFVGSYETTHLHVTGKLHYDTKKDM